jgi:hypothetical protein
MKTHTEANTETSASQFKLSNLDHLKNLKKIFLKAKNLKGGTLIKTKIKFFFFFFFFTFETSF